jgi:hypothetical protein
MKPIKSIRTLATTFSLAIALTLPTQVRADEFWNGGSGTWDFNNTPNWNAGTWTSNAQTANFNSTPGTVTVDNSLGQVGATQLAFNRTSGSPGTWDVTGGPVAITGELYTAIVYDGGNDNVTIDSNMTVDTTVATDRYNFFNGYSGSNLTSNGNITFGAQPFTSNGGRSFIVGSGNNADNIYLNGVYSDSSALGGPALELRAGEGGGDQSHTYINGNISGLTLGLSIGEGNIVISPTAVLGSHQIFMYNDQGISQQNTALLGSNGVTISNFVYASAKYDFGGGSATRYGSVTEGVSDTSTVTFSGGIALDSTNLNLKAGAGGRAVITGNIGGASPAGLVKNGAGTVVLASASGNNYNTTADSGPTGSVAMDIQQGTLLITNTSGSAFGSSQIYDPNAPNGQGGFGAVVPNPGVVKVEAGAKLGGSGISTQAVTVASGGIIAPGDSGADNGTVAIQTLHLTGGLSMASGAILSFKLNGAANDMLDLGAGALTLAGTTNVDFTSLGTVNVWTPTNANYYTLASGTGTWSSSPTFNFNAPAGYVVDHYVYNTSTDTFAVDFKAVPEPSTYALMIGGLAFLGFCVRRKNRMV